MDLRSILGNVAASWGKLLVYVFSPFVVYFCLYFIVVSAEGQPLDVVTLGHWLLVALACAEVPALLTGIVVLGRFKTSRRWVYIGASALIGALGSALWIALLGLALVDGSERPSILFNTICGLAFGLVCGGLTSFPWRRPKG